MSEPTLKKTHELLEKLASYVMNEVARKDEVPTKKEMNDRFEQLDRRFEQLDLHFDKVEQRLGCVEGDVKLILDDMDSQVKDIEIVKTEQAAMHSGLKRLESRVVDMEKKVL